MYEYYRLIYGDAKRSLSKFIGCEIFFLILGAAIFGPVVAWIVSQLIGLSGRGAISNVEIAQFLLSPLGCLTLISFVTLSWLILSLGHAGLLMIQVGQLNVQPQSLPQTVMTVVKRAPRLTKLAFIYVVIFLAVAAPFLIVAGLTYQWLLSEFDINYYLAAKPPEFLLALLIGAILVIGLAVAWSFVFARTIYALPECMLNSQLPVAAIKRSFQMTRKRHWKIFGLIIRWFLLASLVSGLVVVVIQPIEYLALRAAGNSFAIVAVTIGLMLTLNFLGGLVATLFGTITQSLLIGRLYWSHLSEETQAPVQTEDSIEFPGLVSLDPDEVSIKSFAQWMTVKRTVVIAMGLLIVSSLGFSLLLLSTVSFEDRVEVTAHRGSSKAAPENTLSAIRQAIADGADFAEIDVQETADGVIIVMHDSDLMRIAGQRLNIWDTTFADLQKFDAGRWFDESFAGERVPSLQQVIEICKGQIKLNIELKFNGHDEELVKRTLDVIKQNDFQSQCIISSLDHQSLHEVASIEPGIKVGAIVGASIGDVAKLPVDFIAINKSEVDRSLVRRVHNRGMQLHVWTVNDEETMSDMIDLGVDNLLTDEPLKLIDLLEQRLSLTGTERLLLAFRELVAN